MKTWLLNFLLLFALFGHVAHSYHEHNHDATLEQCSVCTVDDLSKVITDFNLYTMDITKYPSTYKQTTQSYLDISTPLYRTRAPPIS